MCSTDTDLLVPVLLVGGCFAPLLVGPLPAALLPRGGSICGGVSTSASETR